MSRSTTDAAPVAFLSDAWLAATTAVLRDSDEFRAATAHAELVLANVVDDAPGGRVCYLVRIDHGDADLVRGDPADAQVTAITDYRTAVELARGELNMQNAYMGGRMTVDGDVGRLLANQAALAVLDTLRDRVEVLYP